MCVLCVAQRAASDATPQEVATLLSATGPFCLHFPGAQITIMYHHAQLFKRVVGLELTSSSLHGKHLTNRAIAPAPKKE